MLSAWVARALTLSLATVLANTSASCATCGSIPGYKVERPKALRLAGGGRCVVIFQITAARLNEKRPYARCFHVDTIKIRLQINRTLLCTKTEVGFNLMRQRLSSSLLLLLQSPAEPSAF